MYDDELHLLAADYANMRKDKFNESVEKSLIPPPKYIQKIYQWLWAAHYEGFKNGHIAKLNLAQPKKPPTLIDTVLKHEQQIQELKHLVTPMMEFKRREWVGLTDDERDSITDKVIGFNCWCAWEDDYAKAIEAKLKEKNGE